MGSVLARNRFRRFNSNFTLTRFRAFSLSLMQVLPQRAFTSIADTGTVC